MGSERGSYANPLCQTTAVTAGSFAAPVLDVFLTPLHGLLKKSQPVMRDTALELGPPSGTGKLIPLLLDAGTSRCTRLPPPTDGIFPHLTHGHTSFTAQVQKNVFIITGQFLQNLYKLKSLRVKTLHFCKVFRGAYARCILL